MAFVYNFIIGFVASMIGVIPPGLLNMYAAKISMNEGRKKALLFSAGVCVTVFVQTYVALIFARFLDELYRKQSQRVRILAPPDKPFILKSCLGLERNCGLSNLNF